MSAGIHRTLTLLFLIALAFGLKKAGFLADSERRAMAKIYMNITFPAVVVSSFSFSLGDLSLLWLVPLGLLADGCMMGAVLIFSRGKSREERAFAAVNCSSLNIGTFVLLFLQGYLGPAQLIPVMLFDTGNGLVAFGGTAVAGRAVLNWGQSGALKSALGQLVRTVSIWAYLIMLSLNLLQVRLPDGIYTAAGFIGGANPVLAMLVIGCSLDFSDWSGVFKRIGRLLAVHYATAALLTLAGYFLLPFPHPIRALLTVILFSPLGMIGLIYTDGLGLDRKAAGLLNSVTILVGIVAVTGLISLTGLGQ